MSNFEKWYKDEKDNTSFEQLYQEYITQNGPSSMLKIEWAKRYYKYCVKCVEDSNE